MRRPKLSVLTAVRNGAPFLDETLASIAAQRFTDFEHVVADGASTDGTLELLARHPSAQVVSELDADANEGFRKALARARGDYLCICCVSDGYLEPEWFGLCVELLDKDPELSLVWGFPRHKRADGTLGEISYAELLADPPPRKREHLAFWLATRFWYPEGNYCIRRSVFERCFPGPGGQSLLERVNPFLETVFRFNLYGFLSCHLPVVASYSRVHAGQVTQALGLLEPRSVLEYCAKVDALRTLFLQGGFTPVFRRGDGSVLPGPAARPPERRAALEAHARRRLYGAAVRASARA